MNHNNFQSLFQAYATELNKLSIIGQKQGLSSPEYRMVSTLCLSYREALNKAQNASEVKYDWNLDDPEHVKFCSIETTLLTHDALQRYQDAVKCNDKRLTALTKNELETLEKKAKYIGSILQKTKDDPGEKS